MMKRRYYVLWTSTGLRICANDIYSSKRVTVSPTTSSSFHRQRSYNMNFVKYLVKNPRSIRVERRFYGGTRFKVID